MVVSSAAWLVPCVSVRWARLAATVLHRSVPHASLTPVSPPFHRPLPRRAWKALAHSVTSLTDFLEHTLDHCDPQLAEVFAHSGRRDLSFANPEVKAREGYDVGQLLLSARGYDSALTVENTAAAFVHETRFDTVGSQRQWVIADDHCSVTLNFAAVSAADAARDAIASARNAGAEDEAGSAAGKGETDAKAARADKDKGSKDEKAEPTPAAGQDAASAIMAAVAEKFAKGRPEPHSFVATLGSVLVSITPRTLGLLQTQGACEAPPPPQSAQPPKTADAGEPAAGKKRQTTAGGKKERPRSKSQRGNAEEAVAAPSAAGAAATPNLDAAAAEKSQAPAAAAGWQPVPHERLFFLTLSEPSGLTVRLSPDGSVVLTRGAHNEASSNADPTAIRTHELSRLIRPNGDIVRHLADGGKELLRPDGTVAHLTSEGTWSLTDFSGTRFQWTADADALASAASAAPGPGAALASRPGTADGGSRDSGEQASRGASGSGDAGASAPSTLPALGEESASAAGAEPVLIVRRHAVPENVDVSTREDGVVLVGDANADRAVEFADGTRVTSRHASDGSVTYRVECLGMPSAELVSGAVPRLALTMSDGTIVQHEAQLGRCTIVHTSGAALTLTASGDGSYTPGAAASPGMSDSEATEDSSNSRSTSASTALTMPQSGVSRLSEATPRASHLSHGGSAAHHGGGGGGKRNGGQGSRVVSAGLAGVALGDKLAGGVEAEFLFNFLEGNLRCKKDGQCELALQLATDDAAETPAQRRAAAAAQSSASAPAFEPVVVSAEDERGVDFASRHRPQLFVVQRDGAMRRLLRRREAAAYGRSAELEAGMDVVSRPVEGDLESTVTTFVQNVVPLTKARQAYLAASVLPPSMQRHVPRPFAETGADGQHVIVRQLCWHPLLTPERRDMLLDNLQAHQEWLQQEDDSHVQAMRDTRSADEKQRAASFAEVIERALVLQEEQAMLAEYVWGAGGGRQRTGVFFWVLGVAEVWTGGVNQRRAVQPNTPCSPTSCSPSLSISRVSKSIAEAKTKTAVVSGRTTLEEYFPEDRAEEGSFDELKERLAQRDRPPYFESRRGRQALVAIQAASSALERATARLPTSDPGVKRQQPSTAKASAADAPQSPATAAERPPLPDSHGDADDDAAASEAKTANAMGLPDVADVARAPSAEAVRRSEKTAQAAGTGAASSSDENTNAATEEEEAPALRGATDQGRPSSATLAMAAATAHETLAGAVSQAAAQVASAASRAPLKREGLTSHGSNGGGGGGGDGDHAEPLSPRPPTAESLMRSQPLPPIGSPSSSTRPGAPLGVLTLMPQEVRCLLALFLSLSLSNERHSQPFSPQPTHPPCFSSSARHPLVFSKQARRIA